MIGVRPARDDFWRSDAAADATRFKEWHHFIVLAPGLDLLVNFNLGRIGGGAPRTGRVIVLARTSRWSGFVEACAAVDISRDGCLARFGPHSLAIGADRYRVAIAAPDRGVTIDATFSPAVLPIIARRQRLARGRHLDWSLTARLAVTARIELAGTTVEVRDAAGYHDHNWGQFDWGDDFAWEWGSILPGDGGDWAIVYSNLMNATRTALALEQVFVWRGPHNVLAAGGPDVRSRLTGRFRDPPELRLPGPMALVHPRLDCDVPSRLEVSANNGRDEIAFAFAPESTAQVLVPGDDSLCSTIAINECIGGVAITGRIAGEPIRWEGRGVFEFVR